MKFFYCHCSFQPH